MDAATAAPKRKGRDSPAAVETAAEKRKRHDSPAGVEIDAATAAVEIDATTSAVEINAATSAVEIDAATAAAGINASTVVVEINAALAAAKNRAATIRNAPEYVKLMADYKELIEMEDFSDTALERLQCTFDYAIDEMIAKRPNLAEMSEDLNDLRIRQARKAETRRASTRVTGLVRNLYAVISNGNFGAMKWKTDDTFVIASESSLKKVISNGHFGDLSYFDFHRELKQHGFVKSVCAEYRHKLGHFRRDRPNLLANIVRESKIEALQAKVLDIESKISQIDGRVYGFSDKLDGMLRSFHDK